MSQFYFFSSAPLLVAFSILAPVCGAAPVNYVTAVEIDGQKMEGGSYLDLAIADDKVLKVQSRKTGQLQTVQLTTTMRIPSEIKYEGLKTLFVRIKYKCEVESYFRSLALYNLRARRWIAVSRGTMTAGVNNDETKIDRLDDYVDPKTRQLQVKLYLERPSDEQFIVDFDHFAFAGQPQPVINPHAAATKAAAVEEKQPAMRIHEGAVGSGNAGERAEQLRSEFQR